MSKLDDMRDELDEIIEYFDRKTHELSDRWDISKAHTLYYTKLKNSCKNAVFACSKKHGKRIALGAVPFPYADKLAQSIEYKEYNRAISETTEAINKAFEGD